MSSCTIYKSEKWYKIVTESLTTLGMGGVSTFPIHVLSVDTDHEKLENSIIDCINSSEEGVEMSPDSDKFATHSKNVLQTLQEKNYTNLYKSSRGCSVEKQNTGFNLTLYKHYDSRKPQHGFVGDKSLSFENIDQLVEFLINW